MCTFVFPLARFSNKRASCHLFFIKKKNSLRNCHLKRSYLLISNNLRFLLRIDLLPHSVFYPSMDIHVDFHKTYCYLCLFSQNLLLFLFIFLRSIVIRVHFPNIYCYFCFFSPPRSIVFRVRFSRSVIIF